MITNDKFDPHILTIIKDFKEDYSKYKSRDQTSAILTWLNSQGVYHSEICSMKNNDIVISKKNSGEKHLNGASVVQYKDNTFYIGNLSESKRSGFGIRTFNGSHLIYAGEYKHDVKDGEGRLFSMKSNKWVFKGHYANDFRNGFGHLEKEDGGVYDGNYTNDKMHNHGIMKWSNGDIYDGNFNVDKKEGMGKMIWANGDYYEGQFFQNLMNGKGRYTWKNGEFFEGDFKDGIFCGKGVMDYTSEINIVANGADVQSVRHFQFDVVGHS